MKKLFSTVCITLCLLFSTAAVTAVRADDGNGHDGGYVCVATVAVCPPSVAPPPQPQQSVPSGSDSGAATAAATTGDLSSILLELIKALLPKI